MLGLADRARILDLFEAVMRGPCRRFAELRAQYDSGADPSVVLSDLAAFTHLVTRLKIVPEAASDPTLSETERVRGGAFAEKLSIRALSRAWQILLKRSPRSRPPRARSRPPRWRSCASPTPPTCPPPTRRCVSSGPMRPPRRRAIPPPSRAGRRCRRSPTCGAAAPRRSPRHRGRCRPSRAPAAAPAGMRRAGARRTADPDPRPVRGPDRPGGRQPGHPAPDRAGARRPPRALRGGPDRDPARPGGRPSLATDIAAAIERWTGRRWAVVLSKEAGAPTLDARRRAATETRHENAAADPFVREVLTRFPGAEIVDVRETASEALASAEQEILGEGDAARVDEVDADDP